MSPDSSSICDDKIRVLLVAGGQEFGRAALDFLRRRRGIVLLDPVVTPGQDPNPIRHVHPDVILVDLDAARCAGVGVIPRLLSQHPRAGIIGLSLNNGGAYRRAALEAGADDIVSKAALVSELVPTIDRVSNRAGMRNTS